VQENFVMAAIWRVFGNLQLWLTILKYLGLLLAAASSVWGTVKELTVQRDGNKRLTRAGFLAIGLTLVGLILSIVSEDLQRRKAMKDSVDQVTAEAKRTNAIIIAGQPLSSLRFTWILRGLDPVLLAQLKAGEKSATDFIADQQGERDSQQNSAVVRDRALYPFLIGFAREFTNDRSQMRSSNVIAIMALDDNQNTVLPFGQMSDSSPWGKEDKKSRDPAPRSVEIGDHDDLGNEDLQAWPEIHYDDTTATVSWTLDPLTFASVINRQNRFIVPTANLPRILRVAILFDVKELPFNSRSFALPTDPDFWSYPDYYDQQNENFRGRLKPITKDFASSIQLVPNSSTLIVYNYEFNQVYETLFLDSYGEANNGLRCVVFEYKMIEN
jgi:hypothetical protein